MREKQVVSTKSSALNLEKPIKVFLGEECTLLALIFWTGSKVDWTRNEYDKNNRNKERGKNESLIANPCCIFSFYNEADLVHKLYLTDVMVEIVLLLGYPAPAL